MLTSEAGEHRDRQRTERLEHIPALVHEHGRSGEAGEDPARTSEAVWRHEERAVRVLRRRVDTE